MIPPSETVGESTPTNSIPWDSSWPEWLENSERNQLLGFLEERFGIPQSVFADHYLLRRGPTVWLLTKDNRLPALASLSVKTVGLPVARWVKKRLKPTSAALQLFGKYATKNMLRLEPLQLEELFEKKEIKGEFSLSPGYVIISTETVVIGCGLYLPGRLISQFPRHVFANQSRDFHPAEFRD